MVVACFQREDPIDEADSKEVFVVDNESDEGDSIVFGFMCVQPWAIVMGITAFFWLAVRLDDIQLRTAFCGLRKLPSHGELFAEFWRGCAVADERFPEKSTLDLDVEIS